MMAKKVKAGNETGKRKERDSYRPKPLPADNPRRADGEIETIKYIAAVTGTPSLRLAEALGRLIGRGGPFLQPKRVDGSPSPETGDGTGVEIQPISIAEVLSEAAAHDAEVKSFGEAFDEGLARLVRRANAEDESAVVLIHRIAAECVGALRKIARTSPEVVSQVASRSETWPVMTVTNRDYDRVITSESEILGVGTKTDSPFDPLVLKKKATARAKRGLKEDGAGDGGKSENYQDVLDDVVVAVVEWIESCRKTIRTLRRLETIESFDATVLPRQDRRAEFSKLLPPDLSWNILDSLPDLNKSETSFRAWYAVLRIYIIHRYGRRPETHPDFEHLAECGSKKGEVKLLAEDRKPGARRNVIWDRLRATLKTLAKPGDFLPKPKPTTKRNLKAAKK